MPKLLHTADWHLGKRLHDFWLLDQQREALERLMDVIDAERPDALIVAGDVFDTPIPPIRALQLWEWAVDRIVRDLGLPMVVIPGNHDHAERMAMHARLARPAGLYLLNDLDASDAPVRVAGVDLFAVPFHKPPHVRALQNRLAARGDDAQDAVDGTDLGDFDYDAAMRRLLDRARARRDPTVPAVLIAHAFVDGAGDEPDGEDPIAVGGAGGVAPSTLHGFDYVALGHLHAPRTLQGPTTIRYAGSLYPCAFGDANAKSATVVELPAGGGEATVRAVPLEVRRRVRIVDGLTFDQVIERGAAARASAASSGPNVDVGDTGDLDPAANDPDDYLLVRVTDRSPIDHALARLREVHPNALLEQPIVDVRAQERRLSADARTIPVERAFLDFYEHVHGEAPSDLESEILRDVLSGNDDAEAEA